MFSRLERDVVVVLCRCACGPCVCACGGGGRRQSGPRGALAFRVLLPRRRRPLARAGRTLSACATRHSPSPPLLGCGVCTLCCARAGRRRAFRGEHDVSCDHVVNLAPARPAGRAVVEVAIRKHVCVCSCARSRRCGRLRVRPRGCWGFGVCRWAGDAGGSRLLPGVRVGARCRARASGPAPLAEGKGGRTRAATSRACLRAHGERGPSWCGVHTQRVCVCVCAPLAVVATPSHRTHVRLRGERASGLGVGFWLRGVQPRTTVR